MAYIKRFLFVLAICIIMVLPVFAYAGSNVQVNITKHVRNVSRNTGYATSVAASPGEVVEYRIVVTSDQNAQTNIIVTDQFDANSLTYTPNSLMVNGQGHAPGLSSGGLHFAQLSPQGITITYQAQVSGQGQGAIDNQAAVSMPNGRQASARAQVQITGSPVSSQAANQYSGFNSGYSQASSQQTQYTNPSVTNSSFSSTNTASASSNPQTYFVAPETGASGISAAVFALLAVAGFATIRNRKLIAQTILH